MSQEKKEIQPRHKWVWYTGCAAASASIIMGAWGGHKHHWTAETKSLYVQGVQYSLASSIGIILSSHFSKTVYPGYCFLAGILLFCGPIWYKSFTSKRTFAKLMPYGGVFMILAWALMALF